MEYAPFNGGSHQVQIIGCGALDSLFLSGLRYLLYMLLFAMTIFMQLFIVLSV